MQHDSKRSSEPFADLPEFDTSQVPDGWSRNQSIEDEFGVTAVFDHESGDWRVTVSRYDPGKVDGKQVCRKIPGYDDEQLIAPYIETKLRSLSNEYVDFIQIQTDDMDSPDKVPLNGRETIAYPDPTGESLIADLKKKDQQRRSIENSDSDIHDELRKELK